MLNLFSKQIFIFDPLSLFFIAVIALVSIPSIIFSIGYMRAEYSNKKAILAAMLLAIFILSMAMVVTAGNLFSFLVFWELMSLSSYFLVIFDYKHEKSISAGTIYFIMTHIGTAALMAAFFILYSQAGSFDFEAIKQVVLNIPLGMRNIIFLLLLFGFSTKAGIVPVHIWLPYAHPAAPSHVSSIMSGVMIKIAIYGMIRFFVMLLGTGPLWWGGLILVLAIVSCLVGVIYALMDHDLKKLLAYHSVENIGIILLGVGAAMFFTSRGLTLVAALSMCAGLYHLINHALFKGLLFLCSGSILKATGLRNMEKMGGLIKTMPWTALFFLIGAMGISALPPLNGFVSEWLTFQAFFSGVLATQGWIKIFIVLSVAALALTSGLAAACFVKAFGITFLAMPRSAYASDAKEVSFSMKFGMGILAVLVVLFGVCAGLIAPVIFKIAQTTIGGEIGAISFGIVSILPPLMALLLLVFGFIVFAWFKFFMHTKTVSYNTWDCGYYKLDSRTEYTATALSKPFRIAFSFFLLPHRKSEKIHDSLYHVKKFTYETHTTPVFKTYFYDPFLRFVYKTAFTMRKLQPGSINLYIFYILFALVGLLGITALFKL